MKAHRWILLALLVGGSAAWSIEKPEVSGPGDGVKPLPVGLGVAGSDTMLQVGLAWATEYKRANPHVTVSVAGEGSSTGFKSLIDDVADIACSSRPIKESELLKIKAARGFVPVEHIVGYDVIGVYAHRDNPATELTMAQLKAIFGEGGDLDNWAKIVPEFGKEITRIGRSNSSGTYGAFQRLVLGRGNEFKAGTAAAPGSAQLVEFVATTPGAIGYSGFSYKTDGVKFLKLKEGGKDAQAPSDAGYPLRRPLYIYTLKAKPEVARYLDWIKSAAGQGIVADQGFMPIR